MIKQEKIYSDSRDAVFEELYNIALKDKNVIILTCDTGALKFKDFKDNIPSQFYNVGVAEQNAVSVAAGLALSGKHIFLFGLSNFVTLRCFEQIRNDICLMNLPVTILGMGTGYGYSYDGPTHYMLENIAVMNTLPNMMIWNPSDCNMAAELVHLAYKRSAPSFIFIDKELPPLLSIPFNYNIGIAQLTFGLDLVICATGIMVNQALELYKKLLELNIDSSVMDIYCLKPINDELIRWFKEVSYSYKKLIALEENTIIGGLGSSICQMMLENNVFIPARIFGIPDIYHYEIGSRDTIRSLDGLDILNLISRILKWMKE